MKCPKCKYVSFEYLNFCKKCGIELSSHKAEHAIDFPQYSDLGILTMIEESPESEIAEQAMAVAEAEGEETGLQESVETGEVEASGLDLSSLGESMVEEADAGDLELPSDEAVQTPAADDSGSLDLSDMGGSTEEIASISLDDTEQESGEPAVADGAEEIALGEEGEISLDIGSLEEEPAAAIAEEEKGGDISLDIDDIGEADLTAEEGGGEEISLDLDSFEVDEEAAKEPAAGLDSGGLEITGEDAGETSTDETGDTEEIEDLDLGGIDTEATGSGKSETAGVESDAGEDLSLDDLDLDLNLDDDELLGGDESSSDEDDIDLEDLNLDDLKLDDN